MNSHLLGQMVPGHPFTAFLSERIILDNYRGNQISQHNRYDFNQVYNMLKTLLDIAEQGKMQIRTTDLSKRPHNIPGEEKYAEYTWRVHSLFGKGTQDSIRKNLFVDFHRMGLINRFDSKDRALGPFDRKTVKYVSLTNLSYEILDNSSNDSKRLYLYTRAIDNIMKGLVSDLIDILVELKTSYIDIDEYTYLISFLYQDFKGRKIYKDEIINLIREYRGLSRFQKEAVTSIVRELCDPSNFKGNKKEKRDYHNWLNESQQVFMLLNQTVYFELSTKEPRIYLRVDGETVTTDSERLKRSSIQKSIYFDKHKISKKNGFELHHIVPLSWAKSKEEFHLLDQWDNMIYIDGYTHASITQYGNTHVLISFSKDFVYFKNYNLDEVSCKINEQALFSKEMIDLVVFKNQSLLSDLI